MQLYKVNLKYYNLTTLISEHDTSEVIVNAKDFELTFARQQLYEGLFMEMSDTLQFTGVDKTYIDEVYSDWKTRLVSDYFLQVEVFILNKQTLIYEKVFLGVADWSDYKVEEVVSEVFFSEKSVTLNLLNTEEVTQTVIPTSIDREYTFKKEYINASLSAKYKMAEDTEMKIEDGSSNAKVAYLSCEIDDKLLFTNNSDAFVQKKDSEIELYPTYVIHADDTYGINVDLKAIDITVEATDTIVRDYNISLQAVSVVDGILVVQDVLHNYNQNIATPFTYTIPDTTVTSYINTFSNRDNSKGGYFYLRLIYFSNQDIITKISGVKSVNTPDPFLFYNITFPDYDITNISTTNFESLITSVISSANLDIDLTWFQNSDNIKNIVLKKEGFIQSIKPVGGVEYSINFKDLFSFIKKTEFAGIRLDDTGALYLDSLDNIYDRDSTIIDLGIATNLTAGLNDIFTNNILEIGMQSSDSNINLKYKDDEFVTSRKFNIPTGIKASIEHLINEVRIDSSIFNNLALEIYKTSYTFDKGEEFIILKSRIEALGVDVTLIRPLTLVTGYSANAGTGFNIEYSTYNLIKTWRNWFATNLTANNSLLVSEANKNRDITFTDAEISQVVNDVKTFTKTDSPFNGFESQIFGVEKYTAQIPITPTMYNTIKANPNNRCKVNYNGVDYIFFLRNIEIKLLNDSLATIKGWESFNKI